MDEGGLNALWLGVLKKVGIMKFVICDLSQREREDET